VGEKSFVKNDSRDNGAGYGRSSSTSEDDVEDMADEVGGDAIYHCQSSLG
jgi:hypothetical protein